MTSATRIDAALRTAGVQHFDGVSVINEADHVVEIQWSKDFTDEDYVKATLIFRNFDWSTEAAEQDKLIAVRRTAADSIDMVSNNSLLFKAIALFLTKQLEAAVPGYKAPPLDEITDSLKAIIGDPNVQLTTIALPVETITDASLRTAPGATEVSKTGMATLP